MKTPNENYLSPGIPMFRQWLFPGLDVIKPLLAFWVRNTPVIDGSPLKDEWQRDLLVSLLFARAGCYRNGQIANDFRPMIVMWCHFCNGIFTQHFEPYENVDETYQQFRSVWEATNEHLDTYITELLVSIINSTCFYQISQVLYMISVPSQPCIIIISLKY